MKKILIIYFIALVFIFIFRDKLSQKIIVHKLHHEIKPKIYKECKHQQDFFIYNGIKYKIGDKIKMLSIYDVTYYNNSIYDLGTIICIHKNKIIVKYDNNIYNEKIHPRVYNINCDIYNKNLIKYNKCCLKIEKKIDGMNLDVYTKYIICFFAKYYE